MRLCQLESCNLIGLFTYDFTEICKSFITISQVKAA